MARRSSALPQPSRPPEPLWPRHHAAGAAWYSILASLSQMFGITILGTLTIQSQLITPGSLQSGVEGCAGSRIVLANAKKSCWGPSNTTLLAPKLH